MSKLYLLYSLTFLNSVQALAQIINLNNALELAKKNALEFSQIEEKRSSAVWKSKSIDGIFDTQFASHLSLVDDRSKSQTDSFESMESIQHEVSWQKLIQTGAFIKTRLLFQKNSLEFVNTSDPIVLPDGTKINLQDPVKLFPMNPEYQTVLGLEINQPLLRNWQSKEVSLQKEASLAGVINADSEIEQLSQHIAHETEMLFIIYSEMIAKHKLLKQNHNLSSVFYQQMKKREEVGRSDHLDVSEAKSNIVTIEGQLIRMTAAIEQVKKKIMYRVFSIEYKRDGVEIDELDLRKTLVMPAQTKQQTLADALKNRIDLNLLKALKEPLNSNLKLAREKDRPSLDAFIKLDINGLNDSLFDSTIDTKYPKIIFGMKFSMNLDHKMYKAEKNDILAQINELAYKEKLIQHNVEKDIVLLYEEINAAKKYYTQAEVQEKTFENLYKEEQKRIAQARSDEIAAIKYKLNIVSSQIEKLEAQSLARKAESQLKLITNAYYRR